MQSSLARMPTVLATVGPVRSASLRVAQRMANSLRAGRGSGDPSDFQHCGVIWVVVPDAQLDRMLACVPVDGKPVVVFDSARESTSIGTCVATVHAVDPAEKTFAAEGHADALRVLRRVFDGERRKLIEVRSKALFLAAMNFSSRLVLPAFAAAVESFRAAGFSRAEATRAAEVLAMPALRAYSKAGAKAWSPSAGQELKESLDRDFARICGEDSRLAGLYKASIEQALEYFSKGSNALHDYLPWAARRPGKE